MKSIEECLDIILNQLVKDWNKPAEERDHLKGEDLLRRFGLPDHMQKHEFFKRLIDRLEKDGYAEKMETGKPFYSMDHYQQDTLITIEGFYFITEQKGYTQKEIVRKTNLQEVRDRNGRTERNEEQLVTWTENLANRTARLTFWTRLVAIGAIGLVVWEIIVFFLEHC